MSIPSFSVRNPVLVNMAMLVILASGIVFAFTLVREMIPEVRPDKLMIVAVHPGVQPQEMEKAITIKVEEAVRDVPFVDKIDSTISEGRSTTVLTLLHTVKDVNVTLQEVQNEIDTIQDLPDELEKIGVFKIEPRLPVINVAIFGEGTEGSLKRAAREMADDLQELPGISTVAINGIRPDEISVEIDPDKLLEYNLTFNQVASAIREMNIDISGGQLKGTRSSVAIRTLGEQVTAPELEQIVVRGEPDGRKLRLKDVAVVRDGFVETDLESYFNGHPAVNCVVFKEEAQDVIQTASLIKAYVAGKQGLPFDPYGFQAAYAAPWYQRPFSLVSAGLSWTIARLSGRPDPVMYYQQSLAEPFQHQYQIQLNTDLARYVSGRLDLLTRNGQMGLLLVLISLMLFLNWRVAFWAAIGLVVSFLGTFVAMWMLGASINMLSMFGLIIVLGIIVDDAIVIGENIYRHIEEGMPPVKAAIQGAEEVMWPVTIAVLTTIAAFAPLFFIRGQIGDFMKQLPIVVVAALSVSLIEALVILPAHLAHIRPPKSDDPSPASRGTRPSVAQRLADAFGNLRRVQSRVIDKGLLTRYEQMIRLALRWRYATLALAVGLLATSFGLVAGGLVEQVFVQEIDSETLICELEMPVGTTAANVKQQLQQLSRKVVDSPETQNVQMFVARSFDMTGSGAPSSDQSHLGQIVVELKPADQREREGLKSSEQLLAELRDFSRTELLGVNSVTWQAVSGGPGGKDIHIRVTGDELETVQQTVDALQEQLEGYQGVSDLDTNLDIGQREVQLRLLPTAEATGITVGLLGSHVRASMFGRESRRITRNREDVRIVVRYPKRFRENMYNIESMWIPSGLTAATRKWIPLHEVAEVTEAQGYTSIHRSQQRRSVTLLGSLDEAAAGATTAEVLGEVEQRFAASPLAQKHPDITLEFLGKVEEQQKSFAGLAIAFPVAMLMIYTLLAGLFRCYVQPLVVMAAIPFGLQGAIIGHWITGNPITILSWIGFVALSGILVNDSLVLVDFINKHVERGHSRFEATVLGAKLRLRAILLTTLTTIAGLTPLMFETSFQAKFLIPMAVTLTFGLAFATVLTLIIVPTLNMVFFDFKELASLWSQPGGRGEPTVPDAAPSAQAS